MFFWKRSRKVMLSLVLAGLMITLAVSLVIAASGTWQSTGVDGGRIFQLVAAETGPTTTLYARASEVSFNITFRETGGGLWKSTDGAASWQQLPLPTVANNGEEHVHQLTSALGTSADGQTLYAASLAGDFMKWPDSRLWRSTDGGSNWSNTIIPTSTVRVIAPFNAAGRMIAGSDSSLVGAGTTRPLFYSSDGSSWTLAATSPPTANIRTLAESTGGFMYAGGEVDTGGGYEQAVYTSSNGINWTLAYTDSSNDPFIQIVADPTDPNRAYALDNSAGVGPPLSVETGLVYSTTNGGQSWTPLAMQPGQTTPLWFGISAIGVDSAGRLYALYNEASLFGIIESTRLARSTDHGTTWGVVGQANDEAALSSMAIDPHDDSLLYFGSIDYENSKGMYKMPSGYEVSAAALFNFAPANAGLRAYGVQDVAALNQTVYAASGYGIGPYAYGQGILKSTDTGQTWQRDSQGIADMGRAVAIDPTDEKTAYFTGHGLVTQPNLWRTQDGLIWEEPSYDLLGVYISDLDIDPATPSNLYATMYGGGAYSSSDSGDNWSPLPVPANALAIHPTQPMTLYVTQPSPSATAKSTDGGATWTNLNTDPSSCGNDILVNPTNPSHIYATDCNGLFLRSTDDGATWTSHSMTATLGLTQFFLLPPAPGQPMFGRIGYDSQADTIYVALQHYGLVASKDNGDSWSRVTGDGFPQAAIQVPYYHPEDDAMYIGTSTGLWKMSGENLYLPFVSK